LSRPTPDPLDALARLETWLEKCGRCPADVQWCIDAIRTGLRERLAEPEDPMDDAADALQLARARYYAAHAEAIEHALAQAAESLGRARALARSE
jgi:hypothetical protein